MSEIIEKLNKNSGNVEEHKNNQPKPNQINPTPGINYYDFIKEQLTKTYFPEYIGPEKEQTLKQRFLKQRKLSPFSMLSVFNFFAILAVFLYTSNINSNIKEIRNDIQKVAASQWENQNTKSDLNAQAIIAITKEMIDNYYFLGDAKGSIWKQNIITLINNYDIEKNGWATFNIELPQQAFANKGYISFFVKSKVKPTILKIILRDKSNSIVDVLTVNNSISEKEWSFVKLPFSLPKDSSITQIAFEIGTKTTGNPPSSAIMIRNISIISIK